MKFHQTWTRITCTSLVDQYTFLIISRSVHLRMKNVSDKVVEKIETHILMFNNFFSKIVLLYENAEKCCSRVGHRWQYGTCTLHAGYLGLRIHNQDVQYLLLFHCNNGCMNMPQCYVIHTLPVLLIYKIIYFPRVVYLFLILPFYVTGHFTEMDIWFIYIYIHIYTHTHTHTHTLIQKRKLLCWIKHNAMKAYG